MIEIKGLETYFGGKGASGSYQKIINHIPQCDAMVSGFLGADFVIRNMNNLPAKIIGIDIDPKVIALWRQYDNSTFALYNCDFIKAYNEWLSRRLLSFKNPFILLDPPYPWKTRTSNHRYNYELTDPQHVELLTLCRSIEYNVAICTYDNDIYKELLHDWNKIHYESKTQRGMRTETLYMNYNIAKLPLQDKSYTGDNYRERDRIRQKTKRWKNRIEKMSKEERDYLFLELQNYYSKISPHQI